MTQEQRNDDAGRYIVTTGTGSRYLLDLTAETLKHHTAANAPIVEYLDAGFSSCAGMGKN